jgi:hypothetical protein
MKKIIRTILLIGIVLLISGMVLGCGPKSVSLMFLYNDDAYTSVTADGDEVADESEVIVEVGTEVELEVTTTAGYTFAGWVITTNFDDVLTDEPVSTENPYTYTAEVDVFISPKANPNK